MGIAALLPGLRFAKELLDNNEARFAQMLLALQQNGTTPAGPEPKRRGRPPSKTLLEAVAAAQLPAAAEVIPQPLTKRQAAALNPWLKMTPEERKAEMRRRRAVARGEAPSRDKRTSPRKKPKPKGRVYPELPEK